MIPLYNGLKVDCIKEQCNQADVGDIIIFGKNSKNDEWKVLTKKRNRVLVISKNTIETMPYNKSYKAVTWENCTLRSWLNDKYLNSSFNSAEQSLIMSTKVKNHGNKQHNTSGGRDTIDKIFLLSINEVNKYFSSCGERKATLSENTLIEWWLRSPGYSNRFAAYVNDDGSVNTFGCNVSFVKGNVRPALWINLNP